MSTGGYITLVNGTSYDWEQISSETHSYQMDTWSFPPTVAAGTSTTVYFAWDEGIFDDTKDDGGDVYYQLKGTNYNFHIEARASNGQTLQVNLQDISAPQHPQGSILDLGFNQNGYVNLIITGGNGSFNISPIPTNWMQSNLSTLGARTLRQLCIPGSHDAGMSAVNGGTLFGNSAVVQTQTQNILGQLISGARYFDIRPVISGGHYYTGHYSKILNSIWQGANGQSIADIISDINQFTSANAELVILYLSHDLDTDLGNQSYASFTQDQWNGLLQQLSALNNLFVAPPSFNNDLTSLTLDQFIANNKAAVVVVVIDPGASGITLGQYQNKGFYYQPSYSVYNNYSDTDNLNTMIQGQLGEMQTWRQSGGYNLFLLSWTLTQQTKDVLAGPSILTLAGNANPQLYVQLLNQCNSQAFPNIILTDNVNSPDLAALAMAVNQKISG